MTGVLKKGDTVMWRGGFGADSPRKATVEAIEEVPYGDKYGVEVDEMPWDRVVGRTCVVSLDNGHWAYGSQLSPL